MQINKISDYNKEISAAKRPNTLRTSRLPYANVRKKEADTDIKFNKTKQKSSGQFRKPLSDTNSIRKSSGVNNTHINGGTKKAGTILLRTGLFLVTFVLLLFIGLYGVCAVIFLGPSETAREKLTMSLIETSAMKWVPTWFLSDDDINSIKNNSKLTLDDDITDPNQVIIDNNNNITVSLDVQQGFTFTLDKDFTVKSAQSNDKQDTFLDALTGQSFSQACMTLFETLKSNGIVAAAGNRTSDILLCTIASENKISKDISDIVVESADKSGASIRLKAIYISSVDKNIKTLSEKSGITYGKSYFCSLISNETALISVSNIILMPVSDIIAEAKTFQIDVDSLVDFSNGEQTDISDEDGWSEYPDGIKIVTIKGSTYTAHLMIVRDPSKVYIATSTDSFTPSIAGTRLPNQIKTDGAIAGINGGYFLDYVNYNGTQVTNGSIPMGVVVSNGKYVWEGSSADYNFGFVGFNKNDVMIVSTKNLTANQSKELNIRDGVCGGPVLVLNGKAASYNQTKESQSLNPRTAVGQREDGAVLFLCVDGRMANSLGASYADLIDIMIEYGAVNAVNLDGGSSSIMYYFDSRGLYGDKNEYARINTFSALQSEPRRMPTFFMVSK